MSSIPRYFRHLFPMIAAWCLILAGAQAADPSDRSFVEKAASGGTGEVELGKLAQQKASADAVRQFASHMVDDHSKSNDELKRIATTKGLPMPTAPEPPQREAAAKLAKLSGAAFDRGYMDQMVADHKKTIALFEGEARGGKDPDLKAFAEKTLPTLQKHLKMAVDTQTSFRSAGASSPATARHASQP